MGLAYSAMQYATQQHSKQVRKFTNEPYITHLIEVAGICATVAHTHVSVMPEVIIATALLHDIVEDTNSSLPTIYQMFGKEVAYGVQCLTCLPHDDKNVAETEYTKQLAVSASWVQTIKYADMISNLRNVWAHENKFATGFAKRCRERADALNHGDPRLRQLVVELSTEPKKKKNEKLKA